jgi:putative membrane protein
MGTANVIPGVSGGTIAFITGVFDELITALKSFDLAAVKLLFSGRFREFSQHVNLPFLLALFTGVGLAVVTLAAVLSYAFEHYQVYTLAFFFGLILTSIVFVFRFVRKWSVAVIAMLLIGIGIAVGIALLTPGTENTNYGYLFVCGIVAICSMILPGLSGSFVLLIMGNYWLILEAAKNRDLGILLPVMAGCGIGLVAFSRLLDFVLKRFHDQTVGLLTGFVAGSLLIIWPWKITLTEERVLPDGSVKVADTGYEWMLPTLNQEFWIALVFIAVGAALVWGIESLGSGKEAKAA